MFSSSHCTCAPPGTSKSQNHVDPPSVEYSTVPPASTPLSVKSPTLLIWSLLAGLVREAGALAEVERAERATGYVLGGVSPLGQRKRLAAVIDASAERFDTVFVSAGRRGMDVELAPGDLQSLLGARLADLAD